MNLKLSQFQESDIVTLIDWLEGTDEIFLMQFAGPCYSFPLTREQIQNSIDDPASLLFKAVDIDSSRMVGHCQLMRIDHTENTGAVGRMLVKPELRGQGYGLAMLKLLKSYSANTLALRHLTLKVFRFNTGAIRCYEEAGFEEVGSEDRFFNTIDKTWNCISMVCSSIAADHHG